MSMALGLCRDLPGSCFGDVFTFHRKGQEDGGGAEGIFCWMSQRDLELLGTERGTAALDRWLESTEAKVGVVRHRFEAV